MIKLLANENFPYDSVKYLRSNGYDVLAICETNKSIYDEEVLKIAINENRLILTFDRDYGELIFRLNYKPPAGIIYLRLFQFEPDEPGRLIHFLLSNKLLKFESSLTVLEKDKMRQRRY